MADNLLKKQLECMRLSYGAVLLEFYPDGTVLIFADPERYNVTTTAGRGEGRDTSRMNTQVIIAPIFAPHTGVVARPLAPASPAPPSPPSNPLAPPPQHYAPVHSPGAATRLDRNDPRIRELGGPE